MRIEFVKQCDVDIKSIPKSAWGRLQIRTVPRIPTFDTAAVEVHAVQVPTGHYFPVGSIVDLPDELAAEYVDNGTAKVHISPRGQVLLNVERPDETVVIQ